MDECMNSSRISSVVRLTDIEGRAGRAAVRAHAISMRASSQAPSAWGELLNVV